ncbi:hydroxymethylglutaryl-CoA lyase [Gordonia desulfuricans]|uniref:Hydroxymethylglutaryl-CoA lyase n=1 Tax=Gordonia desulfuricans TaxID=89051 RepID=A0A7K3LKN8_9ACTN|nr:MULTISPECIES: hydroxymethylglutaryl-CoA lyase [Gordonia]EMP15317.2 hydroxymethylglutaryl-CoA lyase [Gordonia sp. NB41Y]NDK88794.1 hydroxymethylglutaryl-CoA lyase [Gordonia desulfuricans]WLP92459.1 hydroxymethylglutaryl-CoA lyase [Gordonia sp. NB41Y]
MTAVGSAFPDVHPRAGLPRRVTVYEVGPRDGLQAEATTVPVEIKAEYCRRLIGAGISTLEITSFVSPRWVPQLADAEVLLDRLRTEGVLDTDGLRSVVLTPNARGLARAIAAGAREIAVFVSATETFARRNLNSTVAEALADASRVIAGARAAGIAVRGYISMCFGDPWEGRVSPREVVAIARQLLEMGCAGISLGDTIGVATPGHVLALLDELGRAGIAADRLAVHFHDTYGQALANVLSALEYGITEFDSSAGGLGRCPYAEGATGNLATEDLVWMLHGLGIDTGIDLEELVRTSMWMSTHVGHPPVSPVVAALTSGA